MSKRVLIVKTSSMGDVIHTLPALTDAKKALPDLSFDWVVEKNFAPIVRWHPAINRVIEIEFRQWRKTPWQALKDGKWQAFYKALTEQKYDFIIDAQGLLKSALISYAAKGNRFGLDADSARESYAALFYTYRIKVAKNLHAVTRVRQLFAEVLGYSCPTEPPNYAISENFTLANQSASKQNRHQPYIVFLHGTTWETKLWPETYWQTLGQKLTEKNFDVYIPWGNETEKKRAEKIASYHEKIHVLPPMKLFELAEILVAAEAVVAVDTGLGHLAAALATPTISVYGPTNPNLTGTLGVEQTHLASQFPCAPCLQEKCTYEGASPLKPACFLEITPERVFDQIKKFERTVD